MKRSVLTPAGLIAIILGAVWFLQGIDVLKGSGMSGVTFWAIAGPIVIVIGIGLVYKGVTARESDDL